jgi:hypothetical protein
MGSIRRPFVEPAAFLEVGQEIRTVVPSAQLRSEPADALVGLACNGSAALIAVGAALAANRRRRRRRAIPAVGAQVLHLAPTTAERRHMSRAA